MADTTTRDKELRIKLATIEHERWADWQQWMHSLGNVHVIDGKAMLCFDQDLIDRWNRQIHTPYPALSENEKSSDMEQVDRYWKYITQYGDQREREGQRAAYEKAKGYSKGFNDNVINWIDSDIAVLKDKEIK